MQTVAQTADSALPPLNMLVERRFPLDMNVTLEQIRRLYDGGKAGRWNPHRDIDWSLLAPEKYEPRVREAARRTWSRRAWIESTGLTETPALLMRFCMETGREIDPKFFLTVRNTEEAWHVECFDRIAVAFGGRCETPVERAYESVFNRNLHRRVMDAQQHLDSYVCSFAAFEDGLELELARGWRAGATNPAIATALDKVIEDKARHAAFGWLYLESRAGALECGGTRADRRRTPPLHRRDAVARLPLPVARAGTRGRRGAGRRDHGGRRPRRRHAKFEEETLANYVANARARLAELGVALPMIESNRMRTF